MTGQVTNQITCHDVKRSPKQLKCDLERDCRFGNRGSAAVYTKKYSGSSLLFIHRKSMLTATRYFLTFNPRILSVTTVLQVHSTKLTDIRFSIFEEHLPQTRMMASSRTAPAAAHKTFWDFQPLDSMFPISSENVCSPPHGYVILTTCNLLFR